MSGVKLPDYTVLGPTPTPEAPTSIVEYKAGGPQAAAAQRDLSIAKDVGDISDLYSKTVVNDAFANDFSPQVQQKISDFYNLQGKAAVDGLPVLQQSINDLKNQSSESLVGNQKLMFNEIASNRVQSEMARASMHAGEQQRQYIAKTQDALLNNHVTNIENDPSTYNSELQNINVAVDSYGKQPNVSQSPEEIEQAQNAWKLKATEAKYKTMMTQNVSTAYKDYQANRDSLPGYVQTKLDAQFKPLIREDAADTYINDLSSKITQNYTSSQKPPSGKPFDFTMEHEGGYVTNDSGKGPTNFGINQEANPDIDVSKLTQDQARDVIQTRYANQIGADKMSPALAAVATDTAVNMGVSKAQTLIAQSGGDPQKLIDLRRTEYQRLATNDPERYGKYLNSWNNRLDDLQSALPNFGNNPSPTSGYQTEADYMASHRNDLINDARTWAKTNFPNDPTMENTIKQRVDNMISANVQSQSAQYKQDNQTVMQAITGAKSGGTPPMTFQELSTLPGMSPVLQRVAVQDAKFYEGIDRMISQASSKNVTTNSGNGFDTIARVAEPDDGMHPNAIRSQDHLDKQLGRTDGTGINMKDYNDAKPLLEASTPWKKFIADGLQNTANANGNVDGQGQQRALNWYNQVMKSYVANKSAGEKSVSDNDLIESIRDASAPHQPSRMDQIRNWVKTQLNSNDATQASSSMIMVSDKNGNKFNVAPDKLNGALAAGYTKVQ